MNTFIKSPNKCLKYRKGKISLINKENLINPIIDKCTNYKYHAQIYLRPGIIFASHKKTCFCIIQYI